MSRHTIPIARERATTVRAEAVKDTRMSNLIGAALLLLHIASAALALTYF
jgi:hypothetical protein